MPSNLTLNKDNALFNAVREGTLTSITQLIDQGASPHAYHNIYYQTAIHAAIDEKDADEMSRRKLEFLLSKDICFPNGLEVYLQGNNHTPICYAIAQGKVECVELLLNYQAQYFVCKERNCQGPLFQAIRLQSRSLALKESYALIKTLVSHKSAYEKGCQFLGELLAQEKKGEATVSKELESIYSKVFIEFAQSVRSLNAKQKSIITAIQEGDAISLIVRNFLCSSVYIPMGLMGSNSLEENVMSALEITRLFLEELKVNPDSLDEKGNSALYYTTRPSYIYISLIAALLCST